MSDFTSNFWSLYIGGLSLLSIIACLVLLYISGSTKVKASADNTTGHVWDVDLREMNNPLPKWWVYLFIITALFAVLYGALYPMFGAFPGALNWSSQADHEAQVKKAQAATAPLYAKFTGTPPEKLAGDPAAMAIGERLFMNNCAQCHGYDARGSKGFPNLTDGDWLYGGAPDIIKTTITEGRNGMMPALAASVGSSEDVRNLAQYVLSLSGSPHDAVQASLGKPKFGVCAACHGIDGKGNTAMGAPNLTDNVWLHGWGADAIVKMVTEGKNNHMPAQKAKLTEAQIHVLTAYVWGLSNKPAP